MRGHVPPEGEARPDRRPVRATRAGLTAVLRPPQALETVENDLPARALRLNGLLLDIEPYGPARASSVPQLRPAT